ncbi:MAG TPA: hypothetical protein VGF84_17660 [Micromonosporaceae bacterium]
MTVRELDVDLPEAPRRAFRLSRLRALPTDEKIALGLLAAALLLVVAGTVVPWASTTTQFGTGPRVTDPFTGADRLAQSAYDLIWILILAAGGAAVLDRAHRSLWFGAGMGATVGQLLLLTPVLHNPKLMAPHLPVHHPAELTFRGIGWYCVVAALVTAAAGLLVAVRGRALPPVGRRAATALVLLAVLLAFAAQRMTWIHLNIDARMAATMGITVRTGPAVVFGAWQAMYGAVWTVTLAATGAMLFARRTRPALAAVSAGALATVCMVVASPLQLPTAFFGSDLAPIDISRQRVLGAYVIVIALALFGVAIIAGVGNRIWPSTWPGRATAGLVTAGFALGVVALLSPWHIAPDGDPPLTIGTFVTTPLLAYTLTWLVSLTGLAGAAYADGTLRRLLLAVGTAGVAGQTIVLLPIARHLGLLIPPPLPGNPAGSTGIGTPLALAALAALTVAALVAWLPELIAMGSRSIPVIAVAVIGVGLATLGQVWHWAVVHFAFTEAAARDPSSFGTPVHPLSLSPGRALPMIVVWLVVIDAGAASALTAGRLRRRLIDVALVAAVAQAALTAAFDARLAGSTTQLMGDNHFVGHTVYAPGTWITYLAIAVFAAWLLVSRRRGSEQAMSDVDTTEPEPVTEPEPAAAVDEHALYRRPTT